MERVHHIVAPPFARKMRLEDHLLAHFPMVSKMYLRELVKLGRCHVNGRHENIGYKLRERDFIEIIVDDERGTAMRREDVQLDILHEDNDLIVVVKPAGMLMHPSHREQSGTLLNALAYHVNRDAGVVLRPGLPHRLDKQTSGLVIIAKNARAHRIISSQFLKKQVTKRYLALVDGIVESSEGVIEAPIGRYEELKHWSVKSDGKHATTNYWRRNIGPHASRVHQAPQGTRDACGPSERNCTLLELEPVTGRTNQLRIHCEHIGHPIVGDLSRGGSEHARLCLHAYKLVFRHPTTGEMLEFVREVEFF